jgi:hypothetical protein
MQPNSKKCQSTVHIFRKGKAYFPKWNISDDFKLRRKRAKLFTSNCQPQVIIQTKKIHTAYSIFNPFLFIKNKWLCTSSEGFSAIEINNVICSQKAMLHIKSGVTPRSR